MLRAGGIVLFPTDTLYGLAVDALNEEALARLKVLKGREKKKPVSVIVPSLADMEEHVLLPPEARRIAEAHLPGALTLVLPARAHVPESVTLNGALGVRIPDDPFALALARAFAGPFTATSANKAGHVTPISAMDVITHFGPDAIGIDLIIDDGERAGGNPSTVVTFVDGVPYIIREGVLSRETLGF